MKKMKSKYAGNCQGCGGKIKKGEMIVWSRQIGAYHLPCKPSADSQKDQEYWAGRAEGNRYLANKKLYGSELAEQWEMEAEMFRHNHGL